jgi:fatty acid desaturase
VISITILFDEGGYLDAAGVKQVRTAETLFDVEDRRTRSLVRDLHVPKRAVYWTDLLVTATIGWFAFIMAVQLRPFSAAMLISIAVAAFALYRGLCFVHEISHLNRRALPGFAGVWNVLIGYPLLMPSFVYVGVHQNHHGLSTYGTAKDPEYLPFARSSMMTTVFALESFLIPAALLIRFLVLTPLGLVSPRFQRWLVVHASALTMNLAYRREAEPELVSSIRRQSGIILVAWALLIALVMRGFLPWRVFAIWFAVCSLASFVNTLRTLGAHAYESEGEPLDRSGQLQDSIDTPGALWTELWAPVGLRFHALHHYFPGIPYHNLTEAHRRLVSELPPAAAYRQVSSPGLGHSLRILFAKGFRRS